MPIIYTEVESYNRSIAQVSQSMVVAVSKKDAASQSAYVRGPKRVRQIAQSLEAVLRLPPKQIEQSANVSSFSIDETISAFDTKAQTVRGFFGTGTTKHKSIYGVFQSQETATESVDEMVQSLDVVSGESFLIMADITASALSQGIEQAQSAVQTIMLENPQAGTWTIWLNYAGQVLETEPIPYNATAEQVQTALLSLANVPTEYSIRVSGIAPYIVYFEDAMGHRYIHPLQVETMNLNANAVVNVPSPGNTMGSFPEREITAELLVNNKLVPIKNFSYNEPKGRFGAFLNAQLLIPDSSQIPNGSSIEFRLKIGNTAKVLLKNGVLAGRDYRMGWRSGQNGGPQDEVNFSSLDAVADKATLAPRRPVIMFDPQKVSFASVELKSRDAIKDSGGRPILPVYEPIGGLSMKQVLQRAYTDRGGYCMTTTSNVAAGIKAYLARPDTEQLGLGFKNVYTNIPNFQVQEARFNIDGGWHQAVEPFVGMYNPEYLPIADTLYILNIEFPLPFGALPRVVYMSEMKGLSQTRAFKNDTNAVILTYQQSTAQDPDSATALYRETDDPDVQTSGTPGQIGYTETVTTTTFLRRKLYPSMEVISEQIEEVEVETRMLQAMNPAQPFMEIVGREITKNDFSGDLKVGHTKEVYSQVGLGTAVGVTQTGLIRVIKETNEIQWKDDPTSIGRKVQVSNYTKVTGLVYNRGEVIEVNGVEYVVSVPILLAQSSGMLLMDYQAQQVGDVTERLIEDTKETLRHIQGNQYDNVITTIDYLNGSVKRSITAPRTGDNYSNPFEVRSKSQLFRDLNSEALIGPRVPLSINAGELPYARAIQLKDIALNRAKNPLNETTMPLITVDFGLAKGSVIVGQSRYGYTPRHIVVGLSIEGQAQQGNGHRITMNVDALELPQTN